MMRSCIIAVCASLSVQQLAMASDTSNVYEVPNQMTRKKVQVHPAGGLAANNANEQMVEKKAEVWPDGAMTDKFESDLNLEQVSADGISHVMSPPSHSVWGGGGVGGGESQKRLFRKKSLKQEQMSQIADGEEKEEEEIKESGEEEDEELSEIKEESAAGGNPRAHRRRVTMQELKDLLEEMAPKVAEMAPKVNKMAPEVADMAPKVAEMVPKVNKMAPEVQQVFSTIGQQQGNGIQRGLSQILTGVTGSLEKLTAIEKHLSSGATVPVGPAPSEPDLSA